MGCIARGLSVLLLLIGFPLAALAIPLFASQLVLFSPDTYVGALDRAHALERLPDASAAQLYLSLHYKGEGSENAADSVPGGAPAAFAALDEPQLRALLQRLLAPEQLRPSVDGFFRSFFAAVDGSAQPVAIPLAQLKSHLSGGAAIDAYLQVLRAQRACSEAETQVVIASAKTSVPSCLPTAAVIAQIRPDVEATLNGLIANLPDQQTMSDAIGPDALRGLRTAHTALLLAPLVPLLVLLAALAFAGISRRAGVRATGIVLALLGGLIFVSALPIAGQFDQRWSQATASIPAYWAPSLVTLARDVAREMVTAVEVAIAIAAALVAVGGIALIVISRPVAQRAGAQALPQASPSRNS